uniref:Trehalose-phosphatase n=1 Tax=Haptolina ericina TaxID=156174 RepID=A0A7S3BYA0_9EUKA
MPLRAIFSDLDGTLVHFAKWFEEHGTRIVSTDAERGTAVVESPSGERRDCRLLPSSTMGPGLVSERSVELVAELRAEGVLFVVVTAARKSTLLERLPLLPECDAAVAETGSRVYLGGGSGGVALGTHEQLDLEWAAGLEPTCGPLEREMDPALRPEPLWQFFRMLRDVKGLKVDGRSYYGCFRADTKGDAEVEEQLLAEIRDHLPPGVDWAMNLGKYDFFPSLSGKGNVVAYLQVKWGLAVDECAALFDDDNDLPMARRCGTQLLPGLTSPSVERAALENPEWQVASCAGQGVFAIEECLETLLRRVRAEKVATSNAAADVPVAAR